MKTNQTKPNRSSMLDVGRWMFDVLLRPPLILARQSSILAFLLPLLLLALPAAVQAQWQYTTNDGTITITKYTGPGGSVTIPRTINGLPVTRIGDNAFFENNTLISVIIPDLVTSIGNSAFQNCTWLSSVVTLGNSLTSIGNSAFYYCRLTSVTIPNSVTSIGNSAFEYCQWLTSVMIGNSVTSIGNSTFHYCTSLTSVTIPNSVTSIGGSAFYYCPSLASVTIGNSVTNIGGGAFYYCPSLTSITIPDSVTSIGGNAFYLCRSLTNVTIGNSVTNIGAGAFSYCESLTAITVNANNPADSSVGGVLFNESHTTLIQYPGGKAGSYSIPNSVTSIGYRAFGLCISLASISIPDSVTSIGDSAFYYCTTLTSVTLGNSVTTIGRETFRACASLANVTIPNSVTNIGSAAFADCTSLKAIIVDAFNPFYGSVDGVLFNTKQTALIQYPQGKGGSQYSIPNNVTSIGDLAFYNIYSLTSVTIGNSVTNIGCWAFAYCTGLTTVSIPDSVTSIGRWRFFDTCGASFSGCTSLTSVTIGTSVTSIDSGAFSGCTNLTYVYFKGNAPSNGDFSDTQATVYYLPCVTGWGSTYGGRPTALWCPPEPYTYTTNNGAITIARYYCPTGAVTIPGTINGLPITSIGHGAFYSSIGLTSVTIPDSVTNIGNGAFSNCRSLTAITVDPLNPSYISLDGVLFDQSQTTLLQYPGGKAGSYTIPKSITSVGYRAFAGCTGLTTVTIPDGVTDIGGYAFSGCTNLTGVYFQGNAPILHQGGWGTPWAPVFEGVNATVYYLPGTMGWDEFSANTGLPTALWVLANPLILNIGSSSGVQTNAFGFIISWATNVSVVVEACTNLANPVWSPQRTNTLTDGWSYFSDPQWTNYPARFYRLRSP